MDANLRRGLAAELAGTFAVVYFTAGAVCVNALTTRGIETGTTALQAMQPGLVGLALAQAAILAAALAVTMRLSGGYLNPAITLMLWVFNRLDSKRMACFLVAQLAGALLAGGCLRFTFEDAVLSNARLGTPHLSPDAFSPAVGSAAILAGTSIELILTFFLVFAIFGATQGSVDADRAALPAGLVMLAGVIVAGPLTGAAANPARWFGPAVWELIAGGNPWADTFVYLAGPIVGALAAGFLMARWLYPDSGPAAPTTLKPAAAKPGAAPPKKK
jgi:MIP family channel proteins